MLLIALGAIIGVILVKVLGASGLSNGLTDEAVIRSVTASYPTFCSNGRILAHDLSSVELSLNLPLNPPRTYESHRYWGIQCERDTQIFHGYAAIVDLGTCMLFEPAVNSLTYYMPYHEAFRDYDGSLLQSCPSTPQAQPAAFGRNQLLLG